MKKILRILVSVSLSATSQISAVELNETTQIHGFVNQAYLYSPDNPYAGPDAKDGSFKFREIGINGFTEFSPEFRLAGQILSRQRDEADDGEVRIDFLLADLLMLDNPTTTFGLRVGRVKNNIGLYNAIRDIPSALPGYNVPDSIYFDAFRYTILSTDGINFYGSMLLSENRINWELTAGQKSIDTEDFGYSAFGYPLAKGETDDVPLRVFSVSLTPAFERNLRLGFSLLDLKIKLEDTLSIEEAQARLMAAPPGDIFANPHNYVTGSEVEGLFTIWSAQYSHDNWIITAEYSNLRSDFEAEILGNRFTRKPTAEAYYLQLEWLPNARTSWFSRYEELYLDRDDRIGNQAAVDYNPYRGFGKGWTFGGKWRFANQWSVTGQASFNEGTAWLPTYEGIEDEEIEKYWNYYVLSLNFQF